MVASNLVACVVKLTAPCPERKLCIFLLFWLLQPRLFTLYKNFLLHIMYMLRLSLLLFI